jgi:hypothetical protein
MRKIILLAALAVSLPAHAEDISSNIQSCRQYPSPAAFVQVSTTLMTPKVIDSVSYYPPRYRLEYDGLPVFAVFGADPNDPTFRHSRGAATPAMYGVTVEATPASGESLVAGTAARAEVSGLRRAGHEYIDIICDAQ